MNFLAWVENIFQTTESDVVALIGKIKTGVEVAATDVEAALKWVAANAPAIDSAIEEVVSLVETAGIVNPTVLAAIADANKAVAGLNVFAAQVQAGQALPNAVVEGYVAAKNAQSAAATAAALAANAAPQSTTTTAPATTAPATAPAA